MTGCRFREPRTRPHVLKSTFVTSEVLGSSLVWPFRAIRVMTTCLPFPDGSGHLFYLPSQKKIVTSSQHDEERTATLDRPADRRCAFRCRGGGVPHRHRCRTLNVIDSLPTMSDHG
jgi:hypothetical protein